MFLGLYVKTYGIIFLFLSGTVFLNVSLSASRNFLFHGLLVVLDIFVSKEIFSTR